VEAAAAAAAGGASSAPPNSPPLSPRPSFVRRDSSMAATLRASLSATNLGASLERLGSFATAAPPPVTVDVRYTDDINIVFGDQTPTAGLNVLDTIPEVGAMWRLWVRGLSLDVTVPSDDQAASASSAASPAARPRRPKRQVESQATSSGATSSGTLPEQAAEPSSSSSSQSLPPPTPHANLGVKTISVDWSEPSADEFDAGVLGSLVFTVSLPLVLFTAHLRAGRFWSDSTLLKLGRFSDAAIVFDDGSVNANLRISFERTGAYMTFESLTLAVSAIRIENIADHSRRWGVLLGTVSGLQWLLSGFLERKLLDMISHALVAENQRKRLVAWSEIPMFRDFRAKMSRWQATAAAREALEQQAVGLIQRAWRIRTRRGREDA
jgi:hypothetical protein